MNELKGRLASLPWLLGCGTQEGGAGSCGVGLGGQALRDVSPERSYTLENTMVCACCF